MSAKKDLLFVVSFLMNIVSAAIFVAGYATSEWMTWDRGAEGLWRGCYLLTDGVTERCEKMDILDAPEFITAVRILGGIALLCYAVGMHGYVATDKSFARSTEGKRSVLKLRLQEIAYFLAGLVGIVTCIVYGATFSSHYSDFYTGITLGYSFFLCLAASIVVLAFALTMTLTREYEHDSIRELAAAKLDDLKPELKFPVSVVTLKSWLFDKTHPTPHDQRGVVNEKGDTNNRYSEKHNDTKGSRQTSSIKHRSRLVPWSFVHAVKRLKSGKRKNRISSQNTNLNNIETSATGNKLSA